MSSCEMSDVRDVRSEMEGWRNGRRLLRVRVATEEGVQGERVTGLCGLEVRRSRASDCQNTAPSQTSHLHKGDRPRRLASRMGQATHTFWTVCGL
jgi:hypothetical protein